MYGNPYYNPNQQQRFQGMGIPTQQVLTQPYTQPVQPIQPIQQTQIGLLGKSVDSIEVVKAMDIPLDGSVSYFPLTDGSAIVTKQLQTDGTSKTVIYKPTESDKNDTPKYVTVEELEQAIADIDLGDLQEIEDQLRDIRKELKDLRGKSKSKED